MMDMVRIYDRKGCQRCLSWKRQRNGRYKVDRSFYDNEGCYISWKSQTFCDVVMETILKAIEWASHYYIVEKY